MASTPNRFIWYELMTSDPKAAEAFYAAVVGWRPEPMGGDHNYTVFNAGDVGIAGVMPLPQHVASTGQGPTWVGYIYTADVDATTASVAKAGGAIHQPPADIPGICRFSVVADPQGATFMLMTPEGEDRPPAPFGTPGHVGWHELYATDWASDFEFYASQFGWTKSTAVDMGPEYGVYQLFSAGNGDAGGMMNRPPQVPVSTWVYYFNVSDIHAAAKRVTDNGGQIMMGPHEVPGGGWIVQCMDPQGATFALTGPGR